MRSPLSLRNWLLFIILNIVIAAATAFIVVRMLTQAASRPDPAVLDAPVAEVPITAPTQAINASNAITTTPGNVLQPAPTAVPVQPQPQATQATPAAPDAALTATLATKAVVPANVRISTVVFASQRGREAVVIVNEGDQVDMTGWTLANPRGQTYTFGTVLLFKDSFINLHTTKGVDVPTDLFWNQDAPVWKKGDTATLKRGNDVMATFEVK